MESNYYRGFAVAAGLAVAGFACADGTVTGISANKIAGGVQVVVKGQDLTKPSMAKAFGGTGLILDFEGTLDGRAKKMDVWLGGVTTVKYAQNTTERVRVVVRLSSETSPKLTQIAGGWAITFGGTSVTPTQTIAKSTGFPETVGPLESVVVARAPSDRSEGIATSDAEPAPAKIVHAHRAESHTPTAKPSTTTSDYPETVGPLEPVNLPKATNATASVVSIYGEPTTAQTAPTHRSEKRPGTPKTTPAKPIVSDTPGALYHVTLSKPNSIANGDSPEVTVVTHVVATAPTKAFPATGHSRTTTDGPKGIEKSNAPESLGNSGSTHTTKVDAVSVQSPVVKQQAPPTPHVDPPKPASADALIAAVGPQRLQLSDHALSANEIEKIKSTILPATDAVVQLTTGRTFPTTPPPTDRPIVAGHPTLGNGAGSKGTRDSGPMVSLDFVNTEVAQIVKALALQSGANIVLAPEVSKLHQVTVSLNQVPLAEALDLVTTVSGLKYSKIGTSYVITGSDNFNYVTQQLIGHSDAMLETRVVPIYSGNVKELKGAVTSAISQRDDHSEFEMILPGDPGGLVKQVNRIESATPGGGPATGGAGAAVGQTGATPPTGSQTGSGGATGTPDQSAAAGAGASGAATELRGAKSQFIVLVGPSSGIDQIESLIKETDAKFCQAQGVEAGGDPTIVRSTYPIQSHDVTASQLAMALKPGIVSNDFKVDLYWPPDTFPNQVMIVEGRRNEVNKVLELLQHLDSSGYGDDTQIYDVKYSDPRALREDVQSQIPGLRVSLVPASAGNPRIFVPGSYSETKSQVTTNANQQGSTGAGPASGGAGGSSSVQGPPQGSSQGKSVKGDVGQVEGLQQPFNDFEPDMQPMKLVLRGTADQIAKAQKYLALVDVTPRQVALEMRVMELSREDALNFGIDWNILTGGTVKTINLGQSLVTPGANSAGAHIAGGKWHADVTATLDSIANKNNLIARPNLLALDGRETEIFIGDVIRYVTSIQSTQQGTTVTTDSLPVGVRLAVLPRISGDGTLTMDLRPVVSFLKSFTAVPGGGQLPQTSVRISQSTVSIKDGETIAIGGLIQDQDVKQSSKVPILGDLPFIGQLFRKIQNDKQRSEVVFFLTAKIVDPNDRKNAANPETNAKKNPAEISKDGKG